ncbi:GvpL/GvpF family gas vesicle protein [Streptomyces sp. NPDC057697]|uniref:GvpL/GvpF family gas vesicle protein n=1 Tax=Streptomyces sp. NPDC057697 TaxID=3346219 RepID=UPI00369DD619
MTEEVSYAYAVARDADGSLAEVLAGLQGVSEAPVRLVRAREGHDVVAAVSPVPEPDFREDALRAHLEDLDWLSSVARSHHEVIAALAVRTTVLPLRLATVYLDDERVRAMLRAHDETFDRRLTELAAQVEWGVKLYVEVAAPSGSPAAEADEASGLSPGRAYLSRRRAQRHAREDAFQDAERAAERVRVAACAHAVDRVQHRLQQGELALRPGENVVNDAYLVPLGRTEEFRAAVTRAAEGFEGVRVEITGPWPPYSFAAEVEPLRGAAP